MIIPLKPLLMAKSKGRPELRTVEAFQLPLEPVARAFGLSKLPLIPIPGYEVSILTLHYTVC